MAEDLPPIPLDAGPDDGPDPAEIRKAKRRLRREIARRVRAMSADERLAESARVCEILAESAEYASARSILMYHALEDEVDLGTLIEEAIHSGREVLLPVVTEGRPDMKVVSVGDPARDLREGAFGIMEPRRGMPLEDLSAIDLVLVPGRAFDRSGGRLGRGGGFYDRFLRRLRPRESGGPAESTSLPGRRGPPKIGVALSCQVVDSVPRTRMDVLVDGVVTTGGLEKCFSEPGDAH